jgi:hypothetical protein
MINILNQQSTTAQKEELSQIEAFLKHQWQAIDATPDAETGANH